MSVPSKQARLETRGYSWGGLRPRQWAGLVAFTGMLGGCLALVATDGFTTEHYLWNWESFNERHVKHDFQIPFEARSVNARFHNSFWGHELAVTFRLPETYTPDAWIKRIASDSGLGEQSRIDRFHYDEGGKFYTVSYDPRTRLYAVYRNVF